jgi:glutamine synthetase
MATIAKTTAPARPSKTAEISRLLKLIQERKIQVVDVKFCDLPGTWQHFSIPASVGRMCSTTVSAAAVDSRLPALAGDMLLLPDPSSAFVNRCSRCRRSR